MFRPHETLNKFNEAMDLILLANGFEYFSDWEYGPQDGWSTGSEHYTLSLMRHDYGYWLILSAHLSGENKGLNMGSSNEASEIIAVRDALQKLW